MKKKAVFLDRDGTIIVDKHYLNDPKGIEYFPRVFEGLRLLRDSGFLLIVVTNQSGLSRGIVQLENMDAIHQRMKADLAREGIDIKAFYYAGDLPGDGSEFRKPAPGMLQLGADEWNVDLGRSWMIGDSESDVKAGLNAGTKSILLNPKPVSQKEIVSNSFSAKDLFEAANLIVKHQP